MIWPFLPDVADWLVARLLDPLARGDVMPGWAPLLGIGFIVGAAVTLTWLGVRWLDRRGEERHLPELESLLETQPWLAPRMRQPSPHAQRGGVYHGLAVAEPDETVTFDAVSATTVIPKVRPVGYRGGRRG